MMSSSIVDGRRRGRTPPRLGWRRRLAARTLHGHPRAAERRALSPAGNANAVLTMRIERVSSIEELRALAEPFLLRNETRHGLLLGVLGAATELPSRAFGAVVVDDTEVVAVGLRKDDRLLLSIEQRTGASRTLVEHDDPRAINRILGPADAVRSATGVIGRPVVRELAQGIYENREVVWPAQRPSGARRLARTDDEPTLTDWLIAIVAEHEGDVYPRDVAAAVIARQVAAGEIHVWDAGDEIVSSAAAVGPTRNAIRINLVYTPPASRRRGYATSLVADLTSSLLESGRRFVFLHTDLANPTSNAIYQRIGYRCVGEFLMVRFGD
jgi:predicted GNAT family acetyltransferase